MSDYKALAKHSANYLAATIATKALGFISIPIYVRLLTVHDYGVMQVFMSTAGIMQVILTLNSEVAVSRYYYDAKDEQDFKEFVTTTIKLTTRIWCLMFAITLLCVPFLAKEFSFSKLLTIALIPVASYSSINSIFQQIYNPLLQSRKIATVTSIQTYLAFGLSVVFILLLDNDKYYGYALGTISAMLILSIYIIRQITPFYIKSRISKKHIKYILSYCLPYIPYTLSGVILAEFGKIVMSNYGGFEVAGQYSFVANIAGLMLVLISVAHSAWNPFYLRYMTDKDYVSIDKDYDLIWRVTLVGAIGLSLFGKELGFILGKPEYLSNIYILPILVLGYVFYQWAYVYLRSTGFANKTIWNAVAVVTGGICNIILNVLLVSKFKEIGIAVSFSFSYFVMLIVSYLINRYILKQYTPSIWRFIRPLLFSLPFMAISGYLINLGGYFDWVHIGYKLVVLLLFSIILMRHFIRMTYRHFRQKVN